MRFVAVGVAHMWLKLVRRSLTTFQSPNTAICPCNKHRNRALKPAARARPRPRPSPSKLCQVCLLASKVKQLSIILRISTLDNVNPASRLPDGLSERLTGPQHTTYIHRSPEIQSTIMRGDAFKCLFKLRCTGEKLILSPIALPVASHENSSNGHFVWPVNCSDPVSSVH